MPLFIVVPVYLFFLFLINYEVERVVYNYNYSMHLFNGYVTFTKPNLVLKDDIEFVKLQSLQEKLLKELWHNKEYAEGSVRLYFSRRFSRHRIRTTKVFSGCVTFENVNVSYIYYSLSVTSSFWNDFKLSEEISEYFWNNCKKHKYISCRISNFNWLSNYKYCGNCRVILKKSLFLRLYERLVVFNCV